MVRRKPAGDALMHDGREQSRLVILRRRILYHPFSALCGVGVIITPIVATRIDVVTLRIESHILAITQPLIYFKFAMLTRHAS